MPVHKNGRRVVVYRPYAHRKTVTAIPVEHDISHSHVSQWCFFDVKKIDDLLEGRGWMDIQCPVPEPGSVASRLGV